MVAAATGCGAGVAGVTGAGATIGRGTGTGAGAVTGCGAAAAGAGMLIRTTGTGEGGGAPGVADGGVTAGGLMRASVAAGAGVAVTVGLTRGGTGEGAGGVAFAMLGGGGAISVGGAIRVEGGVVAVADADIATGPLTFPNKRFTSSLIRADKSTPHSGQANVTGLRTISGEASNAYLLPQSHWIFIRRQGLGFNSTMFVPKGKAMEETAGDDFISPSQKRRLPPYL